MGISAWFIMGLAYGMVIGFIITLFSTRLAIKRKKKEMALLRRLDLKSLGFDEEECREHHLPGDCPLCGAE